MEARRQLVIVADDLGIGPATSRGILDLANRGHVTATVLLVNSPHAEEAVRDWRREGGPGCVELGWHVCLTLDRPILPPHQVPSLVDASGQFLSLGVFTRRALIGRISPSEIAAELRAQYERFRQLTGQAPTVVNGHHHVHVFPIVAAALLELLAGQSLRPYMRRVRETLPMLKAEPRARLKRLFLTTLGRRRCPALDRERFAGNDALVGITDPHGLAHPDEARGVPALGRWLEATAGNVVELVCHPGYHDEKARRGDSALSLTRLLPGFAVACGPEARARERDFLARKDLAELFARMHFTLVAPRRLHAGEARALPRSA